MILPRVILKGNIGSFKAKKLKVPNSSLIANTHHNTKTNTTPVVI